MALRLQASGLEDLAGTAWTLEIYDSDYAAGTVDFEVDAGSLQIKYEGNASKTYSPITPSTLSFRFVVQNGIHETFISDLVSSPEDEFTVKLLKGSNLYWAGRLVVDQVGYDDQYYPYTLDMKAVCGLSVLKDVEYWNAGTPYTGFETALEHVQNILAKIGTDGLWGVTDDYLVTHINWFEDHMDTTSQIDPWVYTRVNHSAFYKESDGGEIEHMSCYDVLQTILTTFNANIRLSTGAWYVNQLTEYANSTQPRISYYKSGLQKVVSAGTSYDISVDQTRTTDAGTGRWRTGGAFTFTPQLREVQLTYENDIPNNLLGEQTWNHVTGSDPYDAGTVAVGDGNVALKFTGTLNLTMDAIASSQIIHLHRFQFSVKVGSYYLKRNLLSWNPGQNTAILNGAEWTTDVEVFEWWTDSINPDNYITIGGIINEYNIDIPITWTSPPIEETGEVTIDFYRVDTYHYTTGASVDFTGLNMTYTLFGNALQAVNGNGGGVNSQAVIYTASNPDTDNNTKIDRYKTIIGDGPNEAYPGHLEVSDGSTWEQSAEWRIADAGTAYEIGQLFVREMMAMQRAPRKVFNGSIIGQAEPTGVSAPDAHERVEILSGEYYYLLTGTLTIDEWRWSGTWLLVEKNATGVTVNNNVDVPMDSPIFGGGGGNNGNGVPPINDAPIGGTQLIQTGQFLTGYATAGGLDYLPVNDAYILPGQINEGDVVQVISPEGGNTFEFTVAEDHPGGTVGIAAFTQLPFDIPSNSIIQVYQPQTVQGQINTNDTVQQVFTEDTTNLTDPDYLAHTLGELYTDVDAGDGATEGVTIDSTGLKQYKSNSATPVFWSRADDNFANALAFVFQAQATELTKENYLFYVYKGVYAALADTTATRPIKAAHKTFHCVGYNTNVTVATLGPFLPIGTEWSGYYFGRFKVTCQSYGSGAGNNTLKIYKNGVLQITAGFTIPLWNNISPIAMSLLDVFHFEVSAVRATPPKGLLIEMEFVVS